MINLKTSHNRDESRFTHISKQNHVNNRWDHATTNHCKSKKRKKTKRQTSALIYKSGRLRSDVWRITIIIPKQTHKQCKIIKWKKKKRSMMVSNNPWTWSVLPGNTLLQPEFAWLQPNFFPSGSRFPVIILRQPILHTEVGVEADEGEEERRSLRVRGGGEIGEGQVLFHSFIFWFPSPCSNIFFFSPPSVQLSRWPTTGVYKYIKII